MNRMLPAAVVVTAIATPVASAHISAQQFQPEVAGKATLLARVTVTASEFKYVLSKKSARRGVVIFRVKNVGKLGHDFQIKGRKTRVIKPGRSATLTVTFLKKGHYPYKCTVPGHAAAGMKGMFTIT